MNVTRRPAHDSDSPALFDLHRTLFRAYIEDLWGWDETWQRDDFARRLGDAEWNVLERDGTVVGYLERVTDDRRIDVRNLALDSSVQGQGIGTAIMRDLQAEARSKNLAIELRAFPANDGARRFYRRLGFAEVDSTREFVRLAWRPDANQGGDS